ncbi:hypothetical protein F5Y03DRAFT_406721 [Xylaria venustula]|nr:hypothetical protein F5Y03DRAFT_406721 [Xylaria venustula]
MSSPKQIVSHGARPSPQWHEDAKESWQERRRILLPFDLRDLSITIYQDEVRELLYHIFPETTNVSEARWRSHLIFQVDTLPKSPSPLTIGGVPFTILSQDDNGRALIFPRQILGNFRISICQQGHKFDEFSDRTLRDLGTGVHAWFKQNLPETRIVEVMLTSERTVYVVLEDHADILSVRTALPGRIAGFPVGYLTNCELRRPLWANYPARRQFERQPISDAMDDTEYEILRPGVFISSQMVDEYGQPVVSSITSGILVQNNSGSHFMTAASHGIGGDGCIWQGVDTGKLIGETAFELSFTDISLVNLRNNTAFVNETSEMISGQSPKFSRLAASEDKVIFNNHCFLNSPYTGNMEGSIVSKSVKLETSMHTAEDELRCVIYNWCYMGQIEGNQNHVRPPDSTCGSAVWDDDGIITGFHHYYIQEGPWSGFSVSVSASELVEAGYTLAKE